MKVFMRLLKEIAVSIFVSSFGSSCTSTQPQKDNWII